MVNKDFLREIFVEQKRLLKLSEVKWIAVPRYDELSVQNMYPKFKKDPQLSMLMPNHLPKGRLPDREYFFNCLNTLYPQYTAELVSEANKNRFESSRKSDDHAVVKVSQEWWDKLTEIPFKSRKYISYINLHRTQGNNAPSSKVRSEACMCKEGEEDIHSS